ncbi:hypothetical protein MRY82_05470 [bacterium]|nr:hypothetical protein [bacterium]
MYRGKHFILLLLFAHTTFAHAQGLEFFDKIYQALQNNRYVLIESNPEMQFELDMHTGKEFLVVVNYQLTFSMGNKVFEHEQHHHHLSVYINNYESNYILEDGIIYEKVDDVLMYYEDPKQYAYINKYMPVFSDSKIIVSCAPEYQQTIVKTLQNWEVLYDDKVFSTSSYAIENYNRFFRAIQRLVDTLEDSNCQLASS